MRKIISLLMIALSVFFAMPELLALNPPNATPTAPPDDDDDDTEEKPEGGTGPGNTPCPKGCVTGLDCKEDPCKCKVSDCSDNCCDKDNSTSCSIDMTIPFGRILHRNSGTAALTIHRDKASSSLFSPQALDYSLPEASTIAHVQTEDLAEGISREVAIQRPNGKYAYYTFKTGESTGYPFGDTIQFSSKLIMLDASGNPVTDNPVFYERVLSTTGKIRYSAVAKTIVYIEDSKGAKIDISNADYGMDIIRDEYDNLRQIWSMADGLCDIVVIDEYKYEVRLYNPENAGSKNTSTGLYVPIGTPRSVWSIENPLRSDTNFDNVKITELVNGTSYIYDWQYNELLDQWTVSAGSGSRIASMSKLWNTARTKMNFVQEMKDASGNLSYRRWGVTTKKAWGDVTTEEHMGNNDSPLTSLYYTYYEDAAETGKYGRIKTTQKNDQWTCVDYDTEGRLITVSEVWLDAAPGSSADQVKTYYYSYTPVDPEDTLEFNDQRYRTIEIRIQNIPTEKYYYAYKTINGEKVEIEEVAISPTAAYGASENMRRVTTYYGTSAGTRLVGRIKSVVKVNETMETYSYEYGTYTVNADPVSSTFTPGTGYAMRKTITNGTTTSPDGIAGKTLRETTVTDEFGNDVLEEKYVYTGSGYEKIAWTASIYDTEHHVTASYFSNNTSTAATWNCCHKASETTADGTEYTYTYDLLKRRTSITKKGHGGSPDIVTTFTYDASGNLTGKTVSAGGLSLSTSKTYNLASRILSETDSRGLTTTYAYSPNGKTVTKTLPGGFTEITENYADGQTKSITGTAVVSQYYQYGVNSDGARWMRIHTGSSASPRWVKRTTDMIKRVSKNEQSGYNGSTIVTQYFYNSKGHIVKISRSGAADTLYAYDEVGNQTRTCLDVNANGTIDLASMDRVSEADTSIVNEDSAWWQKSVSKVYATDNDATAATTGTTKNQLTALPVGTVSKQISIDIHGNAITATTTLDKANKTVTRTADVPNSTADAVEIAVNELLQSSQSASNLVTTYVYDALGRKTGVTDPRTGSSVTHYNTLGQVDYVEDAAGNRTSYAYETATGRNLSVTNALNKSTIYTYNERGQTLSIRGDTEYPVDYVYDSYGQTIQLKTYRADLNTSDITTWNYEAATGLLLSKTDASNKSTSYAYTTDSKLFTRTFARGVSTTYAYDSNTGEMLSVDYSDSTPDVAYTYNRLGQQKTITDALGSRTFAYNSNLQLESEAISGLYNKSIVRAYSSTGVIGRYSGITLASEYSLGYDYDGYGRLASIMNGTDTFTYSYLANSDLMANIAMPNNITVTNTYEANRNLITGVENKYSSTTVSKYDYVNDAIARRTSMVKSGTAFSQTDTITYGYNDRSEVTSSVATNDSTYNFGFSFDNIGNRITSTESGILRNYTSNLLNQYTQVDNPSSSPTYDDDGNMLTNGTWIYTWDAENRLISAVSGTQALQFKYDYMSRRIEKTVFNEGSITKSERFIYDSYKQIEKLDAANGNILLQKFVWSGEQLLSMSDTNSTYYYFADANKNIGQLLNSNGNIVANYEYSPFGKLMGNSDSVNNPFRFSSEYYDDESGLVYYNYRYYLPSLGRWLSRDPVGEKEDNNLYSICSNELINNVDNLGLKKKNINVTSIEKFPEISSNGQKVEGAFTIGDCSCGKGHTSVFNLTYSFCTGFCSKAVIQNKFKLTPCFKNGIQTGTMLEYSQYFYETFSFSCCVKSTGTLVDFELSPTPLKPKPYK